ncbi:MAG TPA: hypothetical protein VEX88_15475 [Glaciibacter sp.]|nr:hypothetical protein [Glaciibacter sp.]
MVGPHAGEERLPDAESNFLREAGGIDHTDAALPDAYHRLIRETAAREAANNLTPAQMAERLGIETAQVRPWSNANALSAHRLGPKLMFPAWQLTDSPDGQVIPLPHLRDVAWAIGGDLREASWIMTTPQPELTIEGVQLTPVQWLAAGHEAQPVLDILREDIQW